MLNVKKKKKKSTLSIMQTLLLDFNNVICQVTCIYCVHVIFSVLYPYHRGAGVSIVM